MDTEHDQRSERPRPRVVATANGPYRVQGIDRIVWREAIKSDAGEPIAWREHDVVADAEQEYWLCRCGQSANKPFCDGSHRRVGFQTDDVADPGPRSTRAKAYGSDEVGIDDDRALCVHAGFCGTKVTNAWKLAARDELTTADRTQLVAMAQHCPSGALLAHLGGVELEPALPVEVVLMPDGPLWVTGGVPVERSDGVELEPRNRITLCRCGASANKPLCDGSHSEAGFRHRP
jgi:CDGSH-type Zn-finger protein